MGGQCRPSVVVVVLLLLLLLLLFRYFCKIMRNFGAWGEECNFSVEMGCTYMCT
jgi:hypothetical protein